MKGKILRDSSSMTLLGEANSWTQEKEWLLGKGGWRVFFNLYSFTCHENLLNAAELYS